MLCSTPFGCVDITVPLQLLCVSAVATCTRIFCMNIQFVNNAHETNWAFSLLLARKQIYCTCQPCVCASPCRKGTWERPGPELLQVGCAVAQRTCTQAKNRHSQIDTHSYHTQTHTDTHTHTHTQIDTDRHTHTHTHTHTTAVVNNGHSTLTGDFLRYHVGNDGFSHQRALLFVGQPMPIGVSFVDRRPVIALRRL